MQLTKGLYDRYEPFVPGVVVEIPVLKESVSELAARLVETIDTKFTPVLQKEAADWKAEDEAWGAAEPKIEGEDAEQTLYTTLLEHAMRVRGHVLYVGDTTVEVGRPRGTSKLVVTVSTSTRTSPSKKCIGVLEVTVVGDTWFLTGTMDGHPARHRFQIQDTQTHGSAWQQIINNAIRCRSALYRQEQLRLHQRHQSQAAAEPAPEPFGWEQIEEELSNLPNEEVKTKGATIGYSSELDEAHRIFFVTSVPGCELGYIQDVGDGRSVRVYVNNVFRTTVQVRSLQELAQQVAKLTKAHARRPRP
jgi:hypothetical protein